MADKKPAEKKTNAEALIETQESLYKKAVTKIEAAPFIVQHTYKRENYLLAASMLEQVGNFKDAEELARKCRKLAQETAQEEKEWLYGRCLEQEEENNTVSDWEKIEADLKKLGDYKDSASHLKKVQGILKKIRTKQRTGRNVVIGLLAVLLAGIIAGYFTGFFRYLFGIGYFYSGQYTHGQAAFEQLGDFLDSEQWAQKCEFAGLKEAGKGDTVIYGDYHWKVLSKRKGTIRLIMVDVSASAEEKLTGSGTVIGGSGSTAEFYSHAYHDAAEAVSWEVSSLRAWLNTEVLENHFDENERAHMQLQVCEADRNEEYGTAYTETTEEYITILSAEETEKYADVISTLSHNWWLRTPGNDMSSAAYYTAKGEVMYYGNRVDEDGMTVRPVITVSLSE